MPTPRPVYLDAHATTACDPRVVERMLPYFQEDFGNAASRNHSWGWSAEAAVDRARAQAAAVINASPKEIVWTSGATESDNLAVLGAAEANRERGDHVVTCVTEHPAVLDPMKELERRGFRVTRLPVDETGLVDLGELREALDNRTILVSIMTANNEIGTIQPIREISDIVRARSKALFHTDAVQAIGKIPVDVESMGIDLLSMSGHKIHGPKGVGALYVRRRRPTVRLQPILHGGGHERGLRSGTLNVPGVVGMGEALEIADREMDDNAERMERLRDELWSRLRDELDGVHRNGHPEKCLPNNLNVSFEGVEAEALLKEMPDVAVSTGAACASASLEPSHVISALGFPPERGQSSIRYGLSRFTTEKEIELAADQAIAGVRKLRAFARSAAS
ncbi:MAG: cysteine desulfurase family protein [bacterium]